MPTYTGTLQSTDTRSTSRYGAYTDEFRVESSGYYNNIRLTSSFDNYLEILGTSGNVVSTSDDTWGTDAGFSGYRYLTAGQIIRVSALNGSAAGNYSLSFTGYYGSERLSSASSSVPSTAGNLSLGGSVNGSLSSGDATNTLRYGYRSDDYNLTGVAAGQRVIVNMTSSWDNYLQVVDRNGALVTYNDDGGTGLNARLDFIYQDGYRIRATSYSGSTGTYSLSAQAVTASIGNLSLGGSVNGSLSSGDATNTLRYGYRSDDYNLLGIEAGQRVIVGMTGRFDTYLQLIDSDGQLVAFDDDGGTGLNSRLDFIYQDGYRLRATSYSGSTGAYTLTANRITNSVGNLSAGSTARGALTSSDASNSLRNGYRSDDYNLLGIETGQRVIVDMTASFDTYLQLIDSDGQLVAFDDDGGTGLNSRLDFIYQDGYRIRATSYSGGTGAYTLTANRITNSVGNLSAGSTARGALTSSDARNGLRNGYRSDDYNLLGIEAGQQVTVSMRSRFDNYLQVIDIEGSVVTENDDARGLNASITFTYQDGYRIRATSYNGAHGSYTISTTRATTSRNQFDAWNPDNDSRDRVTERGASINNTRSIDHLTGVEDQAQQFMLASNRGSYNPYFNASDKNRAPAGIPDSEFAVVDELSRGDSIGLSSRFRNQYSIRRTHYSVGGVGYGIYQRSDLIAWVNTDDESLQRVLNTGNRALNNRNLFTFT